MEVCAESKVARQISRLVWSKTTFIVVAAKQFYSVVLTTTVGLAFSASCVVTLS